MEAYGTVSGDKKVAERRKLLNPMNYIGTDKQAYAADHIRIRVGTEDGNTSFSISAILALELENNTDTDVDYALVCSHMETQTMKESGSHGLTAFVNKADL